MITLAEELDDGDLFRYWIEQANTNPTRVAKALMYCITEDDYRAALMRMKLEGVYTSEALVKITEAAVTFDLGYDLQKVLPFAAYLIDDEREACALLAEQTVCDVHADTGIKIYGVKAAQAIRALPKIRR